MTGQSACRSRQQPTEQFISPFRDGGAYEVGAAVPGQRAWPRVSELEG